MTTPRQLPAGPTSQELQSLPRPTEDDLVPAMGSTKAGRHIMEPTQHEPGAVEGGPSLILLKPGAATETPPISRLESDAPAIKMAGQKRAINSARLKASIHKPFRSPLRLANDASEQHKPATNTSTARNTLSSTPSEGVSKDTAPAIQYSTSERALALSQPLPKVSPSHASSSTLRKPMLGVRRPFRSPIAQGDQSQQNPGESPHSRLIQIQALQSKITELQSSIRKGQQVLLQQERTDTPLEDLIDKWRKASQEAAQVLLEKYSAQEQVFGGYDDSGSAPFTEAVRRRSYSQFNSWGYTGDNSQRKSQDLSELDRDQIQAMEERMKTQDVQHDLPTVEEAIRARIIPDSDTEMEQPAVMTKMQRLLMGLGIKPAVIGYDVEQDAFTSEELSYDST